MDGCGALVPFATPLEGEPLNVADAIQFPAIQLFVERATTAHQGFELNENNVRVVAEICRRLDGIALAIELAAQRTEAFAISAIFSLLKDRFQLLTHGRRTDLPRHQTLAAAIDWSYELLPDNERMVLRRLSVFVGAFVLTVRLADLVAPLENEPWRLRGFRDSFDKSMSGVRSEP